MQNNKDQVNNSENKLLIHINKCSTEQHTK